MRERIASVLDAIGWAVIGLAERIRPKEDIGEGWWTLEKPKPLTTFSAVLHFDDFGSGMNDVTVHKAFYAAVGNVVPTDKMDA